MVMNKYEVLDAILEHISDDLHPARLEVIRDLVLQVDEQPKVVLPQFMADWVSYAKGVNMPLRHILAPDKIRTANYDKWSKDGDDIFNWLYYKDNSDVLARAYLDGFEVEKEALYTVEIPNPHGWGITVLEKSDDGTIFISQLDIAPDNWRSQPEYQLTEAEIKKDFVWAWQWVKPVE